MTRARVVLGKHGISGLMLVLKDSYFKAEDIQVHMHQGKKKIKRRKIMVKNPW